MWKRNEAGEICVLHSCTAKYGNAVKLMPRLEQAERERDEARAYAEQVEAENARLQQTLQRAKEVVDYVADTLPMRNCDANEPSSFPVMRCWVSAAMVTHARDVQRAIASQPDRLAKLAVHIAGEPERTRQAVVKELRLQRRLLCQVDTFEAMAIRLTNRIEELEREAKEAKDG